MIGSSLQPQTQHCSLQAPSRRALRQCRIACSTIRLRRLHADLTSTRPASTVCRSYHDQRRVTQSTRTDAYRDVLQRVVNSVSQLGLAFALVLPNLGLHAVDTADAAAATSRATTEVQQAYDSYSGTYDELDGGAAAEALGFPQLRQALLREARGRVLEVAVGTGLNLPYYQWAQGPGQQQEEQQPEPASSSDGSSAGDGVVSLDAVDISPGMLSQARRRVAASNALRGRPVAFTQADVAALPFPDASFDTVVDTFSLCVFPDPQAALNEMARVVSPSGRLLLLEHVRSDSPLLAAYQDATAGPVAALGKGCVWNQDVEGMAARAGLAVARSQRAAAGTVELIVAQRE